MEFTKWNYKGFKERLLWSILLIGWDRAAGMFTESCVCVTLGNGARTFYKWE